MGLWFKRLDERSRQLWTKFETTGVRQRRMFYRIYYIYPNGVEIRKHSGWMPTIMPGQGGQRLVAEARSIPPGITVRASATRIHLVKGLWEEYAPANPDATSFKSEDINYSVSAKAVEHNKAQVDARFPSKLLARSNYKIEIITYVIKNGYQKVAAKTFNFSSGDANITIKSFDMAGLQSNTKYCFDVKLYMKSDGYWCYSGCKRTNEIQTPTIQSYLSTVTVNNAVTAILSHTAKVYWKVSVKKPNSRYRLFYTGLNGEAIYTGIEVSDAPASGYTNVTIPDAQIPYSRNIQFFVRAYNTYTGYGTYAESNKVTAFMHARFEWDTPKITGNKAILTANEWNRCKEWTGEKVPAFRSSVYYQTATIPEDVITNEEIQAVLDALEIDRTVGDGAAIAAGIFTQIANAINS